MKFVRSLLPLLTFGLAAAPAMAAPMISDPNLLSGLAAIPGDAASSSVFNASYDLPFATNGIGGGPGADFVFDPNDSDQRLAITGFNSAIVDVRIWSGDLRPNQVTIESSTTSKISLTAADYETTLVPLTSLVGQFNPPSGQGYVDFAVSAPAGTKSIFFDFGAGQDTTPSPGFDRISEVQAFAPEPASLGLLGLGGLSLLARRRRV